MRLRLVQEITPEFWDEFVFYVDGLGLEPLVTSASNNRFDQPDYLRCTEPQKAFLYNYFEQLIVNLNVHKETK